MEQGNGGYHGAPPPHPNPNPNPNPHPQSQARPLQFHPPIQMAAHGMPVASPLSQNRPPFRPHFPPHNNNNNNNRPRFQTPNPTASPWNSQQQQQSPPPHWNNHQHQPFQQHPHPRPFQQHPARFPNPSQDPQSCSLSPGMVVGIPVTGVPLMGPGCFANNGFNDGCSAMAMPMPMPMPNQLQHQGPFRQPPSEAYSHSQFGNPYPQPSCPAPEQSAAHQSSPHFFPPNNSEMESNPHFCPPNQAKMDSSPHFCPPNQSKMESLQFCPPNQSKMESNLHFCPPNQSKMESNPQFCPPNQSKMESNPHFCPPNQSKMESNPHFCSSNQSKMESNSHFCPTNQAKMESKPHISPSNQSKKESNPHNCTPNQAKMESNPHFCPPNQSKMESNSNFCPPNQPNMESSPHYCAPNQSKMELNPHNGVPNQPKMELSPHYRPPGSFPASDSPPGVSPEPNSNGNNPSRSSTSGNSSAAPRQYHEWSPQFHGKPNVAPFSIAAQPPFTDPMQPFSGPVSCQSGNPHTVPGSPCLAQPQFSDQQSNTGPNQYPCNEGPMQGYNTPPGVAVGIPVSRAYVPGDLCNTNNIASAFQERHPVDALSPQNDGQLLRQYPHGTCSSPLGSRTTDKRPWRRDEYRSRQESRMSHPRDNPHTPDYMKQGNKRPHGSQFCPGDEKSETNRQRKAGRFQEDRAKPSHESPVKSPRMNAVFPVKENKSILNDERVRDNCSAEKPSLKTMTEEDKRWREERRKHYPIEQNVRRKEEQIKARKERGELVDEDAEKRRQSLREVLAKQVELGVEVAEIPAHYISDQFNGGAKQRWNERGGRGTASERRGYKESRRAEKATERRFPNEAIDKAREGTEEGIKAEGETGGQSSEVRPDGPICRFFQKGHCRKGQRCDFLHVKRQRNPHPSNNNKNKKNTGSSPSMALHRNPSLLSKLLAPEIHRDKSQLLQSFRFMVKNNFFLDWPNKPLDFSLWENQTSGEGENKKATTGCSVDEESLPGEAYKIEAEGFCPEDGEILAASDEETCPPVDEEEEEEEDEDPSPLLDSNNESDVWEVLKQRLIEDTGVLMAAGLPLTQQSL